MVHPFLEQARLYHSPPANKISRWAADARFFPTFCTSTRERAITIRGLFGQSSVYNTGYIRITLYLTYYLNGAQTALTVTTQILFKNA
jgi:hypothetical protein